MQLHQIGIALVLHISLANALGVEPESMASQLKEAAAQSFLRSRDTHDKDVQNKVKVDEMQNMRDPENNGESDGSSLGAVTEYDSTHVADNLTVIGEYERQNDDGTVLTGVNPFENRTLQSLEEDDISDEPESYEQEEDEIPEEWSDTSNSTDEWAYEKAHDDGTVLYGTNPLEAPGFVWEQDELTDEDKPDEKAMADQDTGDDADQPENQVVLHASTNSRTKSPDEYPDEWQTGEEVDDGTVLYGTNPLEDSSPDEDEADDENDAEYNPDHQAVVKVDSTANSTHDEDDEDYDDGKVDYGTNPMEMPDDSDEESNEDDNDVARLNSTHIDDEPEEYDDGTVLYGTNPLEPSAEEESVDSEGSSGSPNKALPAPTSSQETNKTDVEMSV